MTPTEYERRKRIDKEHGEMRTALKKIIEDHEEGAGATELYLIARRAYYATEEK
jgi:hypothetical protein